MSEIEFWAASPFAAVALNADGLVTRANPAAELLLGRSESTMIGAAIGTLLAMPALDEVNQLSESQVGDQRLRLHLAPLRTGQMLTLIPLDIGAPAPRAARSAIGLAEMLAHEIRNPLAGISGAAQLLSMSLSDEDRELTDLIVTETRRLSDLLTPIESLSDLRPPELGAVNLHEVLHRARRSAQLGFAADIVFQEAFDPSLPGAWANGDQLVQVLLNLIRNAVEAGAGSITLRTSYDPGYRRDGVVLPLQVEIEDDGPGVPADLVGLIFDPFVSGRENGTGLGLALVSKLVGDIGGQVSLDNSASGACFRLSLPRAEGVE